MKNRSFARKDIFVKFALIIRQEYVIIGAVLLGAFLRTYQLKSQILIGDEWHALHQALSADGYLSILSTFGWGGHSIPEALYYKFLIDTTGLSEVSIHIPVLFFGILLIVVIPLLVREIIGRYAANLLAWLLALSPFLIFYSRFARPYGTVVLLSFTAVVLFYKWWITGNRYYAAASSASSILSVYFHIVSLPFILGPYVYFFLLILSENSGKRLNSIKRLLKIGITTFFSLALLIGVPVFLSSGAITDKAGDLTIKFDSMAQALWLLTGSTNSMLLSAGIAMLIGAGLLINIMRGQDKRRFFLYLIFLSLIQIIFVVISKPIAGNSLNILARYIIPIQPVLLILLASGIESSLKFLNIRLYLQAFLITIFLFAYLLKGPVPSSVFYYSNSSNLYLLAYMIYGKDFKSIALTKMIKRIPVFYKDLAGFPSNTLTIVEAPYHVNGYHIFIYQLLHRQKVLMGFISGLCSQGRLDELPHSLNNMKFNNFIFLADSDSLRNKGVNFVVFHKNLVNEINDKAEHLNQDVSLCIDQYKARFGVPAFEDQDIAVFSVAPQEAKAE